MITTTETVLIFDETVEVDVELNIMVYDNSFDYAYGSIESTEILSSIDLDSWDVLSARTFDDAASPMAIEESMMDEINAAVKEIDLEKIVAYEIEKANEF